MIKPNELRIGNLVNAHGGGDATFCMPGQPRYLAKITGISTSSISYEVVNDKERQVFGRYYHKSFEAVPLNKEILLKAGFQKKVNEENYYFLNNIGIRITSDGNYSLGYCSVYVICIKHLHELQNIYYSFTGHEIEWK